MVNTIKPECEMQCKIPFTPCCAKADNGTYVNEDVCWVQLIACEEPEASMCFSLRSSIHLVNNYIAFFL